ncbi:MAG: ATP-binding protein [Pleurocapsa sp. MO_226.B13]|nr:ATP-binding protein [Pleurocapsa sp. MO_226.B13]
MSQNQLFAQTRWRLATWYAGIMGAILVLSGLGIYNALIYAHRLTISQELQTVADDFHETLEPILQQPGKLSPAARKILPDVCLVNTECLPLSVSTANEKTSFPHQYHIRLLDPAGNLVAVAGKEKPNLPGQKSSEYLQSMNVKHHNYQQVSMMLHNRHFQIWGYLQVGRSFPEYELYIAYLRLIFLIGLPIIIIILILVSWWLAGKAMQPIAQSYQLLQQFTGDAAHELRTPLAGIQATVESTLMMSIITEAQTRETLQSIGRQNWRLSNLVADLLMLCRIDRQSNIINSDSNEQQVSLAQLTQDIAEDFSFLAIKSKIKLVTQILVAESLTITGNYDRLYRSLSNLVANAIQYTSAGGKVTLILTHCDRYALLSIEDTDIGIAKDDLSKIFDRFYRVGGDRSRHTGGSGLGLSIAQAIIHAHQGTIKVKSKLGKGTIFTIFLPTK